MQRGPLVGDKRRYLVGGIVEYHLGEVGVIYGRGAGGRVSDAPLSVDYIAGGRVRGYAETYT